MVERILVTGGCGLIGSALVDRALRDDARVVVLDNLSTGRPENLPRDARVELVVGDVTDDALVARLVARCDRVAHLAAAVGVGLVLARPTGSLRGALLGSEIVLRHAARMRRPLFFASSSEVYGDAPAARLREDRALGFGSPDAIRWAYAAGKAAGEALAFAYACEYGLPVAVGRFFNVTGPRQSGDHGAVVPAFVAQALAGGPLVVHGDGTQTRSFLDVRDAAEYVWRLWGSARPDGAPCNVGRDHPVTIRALAERVRALVDPRLAIVYRAPAYGAGFRAIAHRRPDTTRLLEVTGWQPRHDLDATLREVIAHSRARVR